MADGDIPGVHSDPLDPEYQEAQDKQESTEAERREADVRAMAERRMNAYKRVFFAGTPSREDREMVMADLQRFTRGESTPWDADARVHAVLTGRHEVWTRIKDHIKLSLDDFIVKYQAGESKEN